MIITIYCKDAISDASSKKLQSMLNGTGLVYCDISAHMCALRSENTTDPSKAKYASESVESIDDYIAVLEELNAVAVAA